MSVARVPDVLFSVTQVFQYDGTQRCDDIPFLIFFIIGLLLVLFFVVPVPFIVSYITIKRPRVKFAMIYQYNFI